MYKNQICISLMNIILKWSTTSQGRTNPRRQVVQATEFFTVTPSIYES